MPDASLCVANPAAPRAARVLVLLLATTALLGFTSTPVADESGIEEIIVTGSRIPRPDFESASPIVSVLQQEAERSAALTVESVLNTLPQLVPTVTSTSNSVGTGQANLDLRGLGAPRMLVLLDGRRMIPASGDGV